jgi:hypothetical protein
MGHTNTYEAQQRELLTALDGSNRALCREECGACALDCEDEGCLRSHQLPTPEQANVIRDILGIHKRREVSAAELERLKAFAFAKKPRCEVSPEQNIALAIVRYPTSHPGSNADFTPRSATATRRVLTDDRP